MVIGTLRRNIRVIVTRHERVEIVDRASGTDRFCVRQLFAVFIHDRQRDIAGSFERDLLSLARLDRQCIGCRIVSGGNRDRDFRFAGDHHSRAAVCGQRIAVDRDGRPGNRGGWIDFQRLFGIEDLIGIFRLGAGEALRRGLCRTCGIGHAQTAERRHAVELQRQIHALCITVRTGLAGSERNRIARRAAGERIVNAGRFGLSRNILISGCTAYVRVNSLDRCSCGVQLEIWIQPSGEAVRHLHGCGMVCQRIRIAVCIKLRVVAAGNLQAALIEPVPGGQAGIYCHCSADRDLAGNHAVALPDIEGIAACRELERTGMVGIRKLLTIIIGCRHGIAAAGIAGEGHGVLGILPGFIGVDLCRDRSCIALCVLAGNAQIVADRCLVFLRCGVLHIGIFFQIVRHDLHQGLQAGGRCAVRGFAEAEMRHRIGSAVNGNAIRRAAVGIVAVDTLNRRNKPIAAIRCKAVFAGVQRLPDSLPIRKGDPCRRNEQLICRFGGKIEISACIDRLRRNCSFLHRFFRGHFRICIFRRHGIHGFFRFNQLCIHCQHAERQAGQEHRQQEQCGGHSFQFHRVTSHQ